MDLKLQGQSAVVVGGAAGIGWAIASEFAAEGARVTIVDREAGVGGTASSLGPDHAGHVADVTDLASLQRVAELVTNAAGRCDHLVYAAGAGSGKFGFPFWNLSPADWPRVLEINLTGAVNVTHAFRESIQASPAGTLLFISSVAGQIGSQTDPPYSAAKAGLINFAQCAARDFAPFGVRVNTICPGMIKTSLNRSVYNAWAASQPSENLPAYEDWADEKIRRVVPLGRWQDPGDVASLAVFLASSRAKNITGQTMNVDGGFVMHS